MCAHSPAQASPCLLLLAATLAFSSAAQAPAPSINKDNPQHMLVLSSSEEAGPTTQADWNLQVLKMLEKRTVKLLEAKVNAHLHTQGASSRPPKFLAESHYVQVGKVKLAVVRVKMPQTVNQVFIYGIRAQEFRRVACIRTDNFDESIPLFSDPCGDKIREVFDVSISR